MTHADPREAHVQVLTAEVRTLVVGSRQVTLSVYNQLDDVHPSEIEPFGRINPKDWAWLFLFTIGRHAATGALVRSYAPRRPGDLGLKGQALNADRVPDYRHWRGEVNAERQRQQLAEIAAQWTALPLIVLAGLR